MLVRYCVGNTFSLTSVADIYFSLNTGVIEFTPLNDNVTSFYISDCSLADFETISGALRQCGFVYLDALGYEVFLA